MKRASPPPLTSKQMASHSRACSLFSPIFCSVLFSSIRAGRFGEARLLATLCQTSPMLTVYASRVLPVKRQEAAS